MEREAIYETLENLSYSKGFYGRLLKDLSDMERHDPEKFEGIMTAWEENCDSSLDLILMIEGG